MTMTTFQSIIVIAAAAAGTIVTRFLPFLVFREGKPIPQFVTYLGKVLPLAVMGMLVVYALRNTPITTGSHGMPELISLAVLTGVNPKWRNRLASIGVGTIVYMILVQCVFL